MTTPPTTSTNAAPRPLFDWLFVLAVLGVLGAIVRVVFFTPFELNQGAAQKIYYIHVSAALSAYLALTVVALMSIVFLWLRDERADRLAESAGEVALLFTTVVLTTGPLWGKPVWGTWWTWDGRLTSTLVLWFLLVGYVLYRALAEGPPDQTARVAAVIGILAAVDVPIVHLSVEWWRTLHPEPVVLRAGDLGGGLPGSMLTTVLVSLVAFTLLLAMLVTLRYRVARLEDDVEALWLASPAADAPR
jgi:heme exporter protein C